MYKLPCVGDRSQIVKVMEKKALKKNNDKIIKSYPSFFRIPTSIHSL